MESDVNDLRLEIKGDLENIKAQLAAVIAQLAAMTEASKVVAELKERLAKAEGYIDDLRQFRWMAAGVLLGLSIAGGFAGHKIAKALEPVAEIAAH